MEEGKEEERLLAQLGMNEYYGSEGFDRPPSDVYDAGLRRERLLARGAYDEYGACGMARRVCYVCVCSRLRVVGALLGHPSGASINIMSLT